MFATHLETWLKPGKRIGIAWCPLRVDTRALWLLTLHHGDVLMFEAAFTCSLEDALTSFCLTWDAVQSRRVRRGDRILYETGTPRRPAVYEVLETRVQTFVDPGPPHTIRDVQGHEILTDLRSDPSYIGIVLGSLADQHARGLNGSHEPETDAEREGRIQQGRP